MVWERYTKDNNPNEDSFFEVRVLKGERFQPRPIACHGLPCRPYQPPFENDELPDWDVELQHFRETEKKVHVLKTIIPAASDVSELQQCYNDITAKGRQTIFEQEIQWQWNSDMSSLMERHDLTEEDKIISEKILEHQERERMNRARAEGGERLDPPELKTPSVFKEILTRFSARGQAFDMLKAQKTRQIWLKVYEELAALYDEQVRSDQSANAVEGDRGDTPGRTRHEADEVIRKKFIEEYKAENGIEPVYNNGRLAKEAHSFRTRFIAEYLNTWMKEAKKENPERMWTNPSGSLRDILNRPPK